jgi:hypothetical protein
MTAYWAYAAASLLSAALAYSFYEIVGYAPGSVMVGVFALSIWAVITGVFIQRARRERRSWWWVLLPAPVVLCRPLLFWAPILAWSISGFAP